MRERAAEQIALVLHEGDIVDADEPTQWSGPRSSCTMLDGVVPYVLTAGNHDYARRPAASIADVDNATSPIATSRRPPVRDRTKPGHIENSFESSTPPAAPGSSCRSSSGRATPCWPGRMRIAKRYAALPAIVVTHAYLHLGRRRATTTSARPEQLWNPHRYLDDTRRRQRERRPGDLAEAGLAATTTSSSCSAATSWATASGGSPACAPTARAVHQMLANYQMRRARGRGYLRLMQFSPAERRVAVRTYSPYFDRFKTDAGQRLHPDLLTRRPTTTRRRPMKRTLIAIACAVVPGTPEPVALAADARAAKAGLRRKAEGARRRERRGQDRRPSPICRAARTRRPRRRPTARSRSRRKAKADAKAAKDKAKEAKTALDCCKNPKKKGCSP